MGRQRASADDTGMDGASATDACLDDARVVALLADALAPTERQAVDAHLVACSGCRRLVSAMAQLDACTGASAREPTCPAAAAPTDAVPEAGVRLGRYRVVAPLAAGGMGRVMLADDVSLGRRVALKFLHPHRDGDRTATIVGEARALARIADPHVVAAFDVGCIDGYAFLAMPWIRGRTLAGWLAAAPRPPSAIAEVFAQLAQALVAVHARGLVHRDVKPANVLVGDDGRVQLIDLGLAEAVADGSGADPGDPQSTRARHVLGTPAYMAPECHRGQPADPFSDQFSFCVALFEALHGVRPFAGDDVDSLIEHVLAGRITRPSRRGVPRWLDRIAVRGLASDRARRWPSMQAIALALRAGPRRAPIVGTAIASAAAAVVAIAAGSAPPAQCDRDGLAGIWDAARRDAVLGIDVRAGEWAARTRDDVERHLDTVAAAWRKTDRAACLAEDPGPRACLDDRRRALAATIDVLAEADADGWAHAADAVRELPSVASCDTADAPPATDEALASGLARVEALRNTGRFDDAIALAHGWLPVAAGLGDDTAARAALGLGLAQVSAHRDPIAALEFAHLAAIRGGDHRMAGRAAIELALASGFDRADLGDAARWLGFADSHAARLPEDHELALALREAHARVAFAAGALDTAVPELAACLAAREAMLGPDDPRLGRHLDALGQAEREAGDLDGALVHHRRAEQLLAIARGDDHPDHASALEQLAHVHTARGELAEARALHARALAIREHALGPEHPHVATSLLNLGELTTGSQPEAAEAMLQRALAIQRTSAADPSDVATTLHGLANVHRVLGRLQAARLDALAAIEILEPRLGALHPTLVALWSQLALVEIELGDPRSALVHARTALAARRAAVGDAHPTLAPSLFAVGLALVELGDDAAATVPLERALALVRGREDGAEHEIGFVLAQALWTQPGQRARARALARAALDGMRRDGAFDPATVAEVDRWLGSHRS